MVEQPSGQPPFPSFHKTLPEEQDLEWFDNTKLVALNTCPTWGTIRYIKKKTIGAGTSRAMALEAGGAAHEAFAAVRMYELMEFGPEFYKTHYPHITDNGRINAHGHKLFGEERWKALSEIFNSADDQRTKYLRGAFHALNTSGFYDDPNDQRRTMSNIEDSLMAYIDRVGLGQSIPYMDGSFIGVEIPFDIVGDFAGRKIRFVGKFDGLSFDRDKPDHIQIDENKTTSRIDEAWHVGYIMSHQITGYLVAASVYLNRLVDNANLLGLAFPLPKSSSYGGFVRHPVSRTPQQFSDWARWVRYTVDEADKWRDQPLNAPRFTHSCNRYFRPCPLVPLCHNSAEEQQEIYNEMVVDEWNPLTEETT